MPRLGEHEIEPHPKGAWRAFVAGCIAAGLLLLGLIAGAHAKAPLASALAPSAMAMAGSTPG